MRPDEERWAWSDLNARPTGHSYSDYEPVALTEFLAQRALSYRPATPRSHSARFKE